MTTKETQHLVPGDRVQTLLGVHRVLRAEKLSVSGNIEYWLEDPEHNQIIIRRSMPEWKVEIV